MLKSFSTQGPMFQHLESRMLLSGNVIYSPDASSIHGIKWHDIDADGIHDANEPGVAGWTIYLDLNNNGGLDAGEPSTVTAVDDLGTPEDETGRYSFFGLEPGTYTVAEVDQAGWTQTSPDDASATLPALLLSDLTNNRIVSYALLQGTATNPIDLVTGDPELGSVGDMRIGPDGNLYAVLHAYDQINRYDLNSGVSLPAPGRTGAVFAGDEPGSGPGTQSGQLLDGPNKLEFGPNGDLFVISNHNNSVVQYDGSTGNHVRTLPFPSTGLVGIAFDGSGRMFVGDFDSDAIYQWNEVTDQFDLFISAGGGGLNGPREMEFGPDGHLYVASAESDHIMRYDGATGVPLPAIGQTGAIFAQTIDFPQDLMFDSNGALCVTSSTTSVVQCFDGTAGQLSATLLDEPANPGFTSLLFHQRNVAITPGTHAVSLTTGEMVEGIDFGNRALNNSPTVAVNNAVVTSSEGSTASNNGTFDDIDSGDEATVFASIGTVTQVGTQSGTWSWSFDATDGPDDSQTVTVTVTDNDGASSTTMFDLVVNNVAPTANDDVAMTNEDEPVPIDVLLNDTDPAEENDPLTIIGITDGNNGTTTANGSQVTYTPNPGFEGADSFTYTIDDGDGGTSTGIVNVLVKNLVDLSGRVFDDLNNDGVFDSGAGEVGLQGVLVKLFDQTSGTLLDSQVTLSDGGYSFDVNLNAGTYKLVQAQPDDYLDGDEMAGTIGGTVDNSQDNNEITDIVVGAPGTTPDGIEFLFAEIRPSSIQGLVWEDFNNDGEVNFGEEAIDNVEIQLTGTDDRGNPIAVQTQLTDTQGIYEFVDLRPGDYIVTETQPSTHQDGVDSAGLINGVPASSPTVNDQFDITLPQPESQAVNFNFGERPLDGGDVTPGQTATIGFWQNKNGQNLIKALNGSSSSTQLGDWLAATLPNMYGVLANASNEEVADVYRQLFKRNGKSSPGGPPKLDAQVLAVALAVYVTNETLAGATATSYGFNVTATGVGTSTFNVGDNGAAFGVADNSVLSVMDILLKTDERSWNGLLFDEDGDGQISAVEEMFRTLANDVYSAMNEQGDI